MPYSAEAVANFILDLCLEREIPVSPMKLQKLVYFAHGWHLALRNEPLLDEQVEAWQYGPVIRSLYSAFREFGNEPITRPAVIPKFERQESGDLTVKYFKPTLDDEGATDATKRLIERVVEVYGSLSAIQLSNVTHQPGTPWQRVFEKFQSAIPKGTDIPQEEITSYFQTMAG